MLDGIRRAVYEAGRMMLRFQAPDIQEKDGHFNYVTQADIAVQSALRDSLTALLPESAFFAEEQENAALTDAPTWVVDPIDGTINYIRQRNASAVSVCLLKGRRPEIAFLYNPYAQEMFHAVRGKGAYCNERQIRVSQTEFDQALVGLGTSPYYADLAAAGLTAALHFLHEAGDLRRSGSAAIDLADVACGRLDVMYELQLSPWDVAAGALLVEEAGGRFDMPWRGEVSFDKPACTLASNPQCYARALEIIREVKPSGKEEAERGGCANEGR